MSNLIRLSSILIWPIIFLCLNINKQNQITVKQMQIPKLKRELEELESECAILEKEIMKKIGPKDLLKWRSGPMSKKYNFSNNTNSFHSEVIVDKNPEKQRIPSLDIDGDV